MKKYYATYSNVGTSDIAIFSNEKDRDDWVNFNDYYSQLIGNNSTIATFQRIRISSEKVRSILKNSAIITKVKDEFDSKIEWYLLT